MHEANLVVAHAYGSEPEAAMAKSALQAAGIDSMIQADAAGGMRPHLAWASGGYKLLVREDDAAAARDVLEPVNEHEG
jgi:Putative prokaryotic signal transducing protein